ncbi:MAG: glutamate--tRNA ligase [Planctomycetes bacterium]|nr:glutamate--tRNA ligase [Planctomycetota bacterium]MCW8136533.1 glutamate--tRNA ligase [Planctomycetota bacterium]
MSAKPARVRVAPSPTGDPHVGTAYMALFNKALADTTGGQFILRIEDTDRTRYVADSEAQIFEALAWLALTPHEGPHKGGPCAPYRQSERLPMYKEAADTLLRHGKAYKCYCTSERLETLRKIQQAEKAKLLGYDGLCRSLSEAEIAANDAAGKPCVVRLKMPREGDIEVHDFFRGVLKFIAAEQQDAVLLKSDGFPTYHLANIVDDHAMGITHVIRAEEWIPSTPLHFELYRAFGWDAPVFAHMPLLRNKDKSKISKRKNPTSLLWYRDAGFLPEALRNFLGLMGFSLPNDQEIFTYDEFLRHFDLAKVNIGGPIFDLQKLHWLNGEYIRKLPHAELEKRLVEQAKLLMHREREFADLPEDQLPQETFLRDFETKRRQRSRVLGALAPELMTSYEVNPQLLAPIIPLIQERMHTLVEAADYLPMFFTREFAYTPEDFIQKKHTLDDAKKALAAAREMLAGSDLEHPDWLTRMDEQSRAKAEQLGMKIGPYLGPVRMAITGSRVSPPLMESIRVLGKEEALRRIDAAINALAQG